MSSETVSTSAVEMPKEVVSKVAADETVAESRPESSTEPSLAAFNDMRVQITRECEREILRVLTKYGCRLVVNPASVVADGKGGFLVSTRIDIALV